MKILRGSSVFIYMLVLYVGLPLFGWGFDDLSGFFSYPQLAGYAVSIAAFGVLVALMIQRPGGAGSHGKGQPDKFVVRQRVVRIAVSLLLFCGLVFVPLTGRRGLWVLPDEPVLRWLGLLFGSLGMGLILWSGFALGRLYSPDVTLQKDHHLITGGPYRWVRHPRYLGGILQGAGLSLLFCSWFGLILAAGFTLIILFRIHDEEIMMRREFGDAWLEYCRKTRRLIPYIY